MMGSRTRREPLLKRADFAAHLEAKARETAPRDVEILLDQAQAAAERAASVSLRMGQQMNLALELLADHAAGECPQIPFYTVSLMAEAVFYVLDPNDVIPDWIPGIGQLDDAVVLELAFELGAAGVGRYCAFKGIDAPFSGISADAGGPGGGATGTAKRAKRASRSGPPRKRTAAAAAKKTKKSTPPTRKRAAKTGGRKTRRSR